MTLTVIVIGASGDLAKKKTYPALFKLFCASLLPESTKIFGYARSAIEDEAFRQRIKGYLKGAPQSVEGFLALCYYRNGGYDSKESFAKLSAELDSIELAGKQQHKAEEEEGANRVFYYAIPPTVFAGVSRAVSAAAMSSTGWNRVVVEKPFGRDSESSALLGAAISSVFQEHQLYRIDHYLGKEMVQNLMALRFANAIFEPVWNRHHIACVQVIFKENFGTKGRGGYFDNYGIIRDVMQNHLLQVMSLVAMEPPLSMDAEDVRDEKVKVLRAVAPIAPQQVLLGQYAADRQEGGEGAYTDDPGVPDDSVTPTFAAAVLQVDNPRWKGVPFVLRCGKALNERKAEIRVQFRPSPVNMFRGQAKRNELVMRIQPNEAVYVKLMSKLPGLGPEVGETELDLTYTSRFPTAYVPDAYERLLLDVLRGDHSSFVRDDELRAAWAIFTPLLHRLEAEQQKPPLYEYGSRGPEGLDEFLRTNGYEFSGTYHWPQSPPAAAPATATAAAAATPAGTAAAAAAATPAAAAAAGTSVGAAAVPLDLGSGDGDAGSSGSGFPQLPSPRLPPTPRTPAGRGQQGPEFRSLQHAFALSADRLSALASEFMAAMRQGLQAEGGSCLAMLPTFVSKLPRGGETGCLHAVHLSEGALQVARVQLAGGGEVSVDATACPLPAPLLSGGSGGGSSGDELFDFIAQAMAGSATGGAGDYGLAISLPMQKSSLVSGSLLASPTAAAALSGGGGGGADVVAQLRAACGRAGIAANVRAVVNDTTATLAAGKYAYPNTMVGVVVGAGTNASYVERRAAISKLPLQPGETQPNSDMAVNVEWGAMGDGSLFNTVLPESVLDQQLDAESGNPSCQRFEKMVSDAYLGELTRRLLLRLVEAHELFPQLSSHMQGQRVAAARSVFETKEESATASPAAAADAGASLSLLRTVGAFRTEWMSAIEFDNSPDLHAVGAILKDHLSLQSSLADRHTVRDACAVVSTRAARLVAAAIAAVVTQMGDRGRTCTVAVDGTVFDHFPSFKQRMEAALAQLRLSCRLVLAKEAAAGGAAVGAALVAALASPAASL